MLIDLEDLDKINAEIAQYEGLMTFDEYVEFQVEYSEWLRYLNMSNHNLYK